MLRTLLMCLTCILFVSTGGCVTANMEKSLVYQPALADVGDWSPPEEIGFEEAQFQSADKTPLHGWFLDHPDRRAVVLFMHGNGGNVALWAHSMQYLVDRHQVAAFVFDYRGYGKSAGKPTEQGLIEDAQAARTWLAQRTGISEDSIVLLGQSLGGGVAVELASGEGARGLILLSTFTSAPDVAAHHMPWMPAHLMMTQRFNSLKKIKNYDGPLLMCHGDADKVIPFEQGEELFAASQSEDKQFIRNEGGGHNSHAPEKYREALDAFLDRLPPEKALSEN